MADLTLKLIKHLMYVCNTILWAMTLKQWFHSDKVRVVFFTNNSNSKRPKDRFLNDQIGMYCHATLL